MVYFLTYFYIKLCYIHINICQILKNTIFPFNKLKMENK